MSYSSPARIDLAGGTLDIAPLCHMIEGAVTVNLAINLRSLVRVHRQPGPISTVSFEGGCKLATSSELLFSEALRYFDVTDPVHFDVQSSVPRASGLGGSSTLLVSVCAAVYRFARHSQISADQLIRMVTVLEHRILQKPAGTQDAIAAIHGGLNVITYEQGSPSSNHLVIPPFLSGPIYLLHTKEQHHSGINNWQIIKAACEGDTSILGLLRALAENAEMLKQAIVCGDPKAFSQALARESEMRNRLAPGILPENMKCFLDQHDGLVGKMCGAGGGGCMLLFGYQPQEKSLAIAQALELTIIEVMADANGTIEVPP